MLVFLVFFWPVCLPMYLWAPLLLQKRLKITASPSETFVSVLESPEVETKEVEVLARSNLLLYSICSLLKWKQWCSIYSS